MMVHHFERFSHSVCLQQTLHRFLSPAPPTKSTLLNKPGIKPSLFGLLTTPLRASCWRDRGLIYPAAGANRL